MAKNSFKETLSYIGYDPEEAYFFEDNRKKLIEFKKSISPNHKNLTKEELEHSNFVAPFTPKKPTQKS